MKVIAKICSAAACSAALTLGVVGSAHAGGVYWSVGVAQPGLQVGVSSLPGAPVVLPPVALVPRPLPVYGPPVVVERPVPVAYGYGYRYGYAGGRRYGYEPSRGGWEREYWSHEHRGDREGWRREGWRREGRR